MPIGIAFVGVGAVAELHHAALAAVPELELVGIVDVDAAKASARAREWHVEPYPSLDACLSDRAVEAVLVLTPIEHHVGAAVQAIGAGRHVLIEKPVSHDPGAIAKLEELARERGVTALPGHNYGHIPEIARIRRLALDGSFGEIRALWITYAIQHNPELIAAYGGVLRAIMVHHSYLALSLLGAPDRIHAGTAPPLTTDEQVDEQAWMTWEYEGGWTAHLFASLAIGDDTESPATFVVKALGTHGGATFSFRSAVFERPLGTLGFAIPAYEESYVHELRAFGAAVAARTAGGLGEALETSHILLAARTAAKEQRAVLRKEWGTRFS